MIIETEIICQSCGEKNLAINNATERYTDTIFCTSCSKKLVSFKFYSGFVYYLSNKSMPGYLKIGCTSRDVISRVKELDNATGVPEPFAVEAFFPSTDHHKDELIIHKSLYKYKVDNKEFFKTDIDKALEKTRDAIENVNLYILNKSNTICTKKQKLPKCFGQRDSNKDIPGKCRSCTYEDRCYKRR